MLRRVLLASLAAFLGYIVVGTIVGLLWVTFFHEAPGGGSGNSRYGFVWFTVGGWFGAILGFVATFRRARSRQGPETAAESKDLAQHALGPQHHEL